MLESADLVEEVKTESSKWIKTKGREFKNFHWIGGYGALSIGQSNIASLKRYILGQKKHHQRVTFQDEYRKFLAAYGINYDERYVWDFACRAFSAQAENVALTGALPQAFTFRALGASTTRAIRTQIGVSGTQLRAICSSIGVIWIQIGRVPTRISLVLVWIASIQIRIGSAIA